jgi:hypothetical protein
MSSSAVILSKVLEFYFILIFTSMEIQNRSPQNLLCEGRSKGVRRRKNHLNQQCVQNHDTIKLNLGKQCITTEKLFNDLNA